MAQLGSGRCRGHSPPAPSWGPSSRSGEYSGSAAGTYFAPYLRRNHVRGGLEGLQRGSRGVTEGRGSPLLLGGELSPLLPPPGGYEGGHARAGEEA
eukprot:1194380-Prorocentrum_minimum.AAC.2